MAVLKSQVFLASRFREFADVRSVVKRRIGAIQRLNAEAVDLNDNAVDSQPPLARCYQAIDQADIVVLLVGDEYGDELADGCSYTHLEYRHAQKSGKMILPFFIGASPEQSSDSLRRWMKEIEGNQLVKRLPPAENAEELGVEIFMAVYERLWEIAIVGDAPPGADDDEAAALREESPIPVELLLRKGDRASQRLQALAADHQREAYEALQLGLPQIAMQQLEKTLDLAPLEIVPTYWLARLLIATGRRPDCEKGLRLTLRCTHLAARKDGPELASMAALILAARASERLNDREGAFEYARAAHAETPWHWLAKVEMGRQSALNGRPAEALRYAEDAIWLRPDALYKIQRDAAYRGLGQRFVNFCGRVRADVEGGAADVLRLEIALRELAVKRSGSVVEPAGPSSATPAQRLSWSSVVRVGRLSAQRTFELLRQWAADLVAQVSTFNAGRFRGLTERTGEEIEKAIDEETATVTSGDRKLRSEKAAISHLGQRMAKTAIYGLLVGGLTGIGLAMAVTADAQPAIVGSSVLLAIIVAIVAIVLFATWPQYQNRAADAAELQAQLERSRKALAALHGAKEQFDSDVEAVRAQVRVFCRAVDEFERRAVEPLPFTPAVPWRRATASEYVRVDAKAKEEDVIAEDDLLPDDLRSFAASPSKPRSAHWIARRIRRDDLEVLRRSAAYFA